MLRNIVPEMNHSVDRNGTRNMYYDFEINVTNWKTQEQERFMISSQMNVIQSHIKA